MNEWMNEWMSEWVNEWTNELISEWVNEGEMIMMMIMMLVTVLMMLLIILDMLSWRPNRLYYVIIKTLIKWLYDDNVNSSLLYQLPWNTSSPRHDQDGRKLPWLNHLTPRRWFGCFVWLWLCCKAFSCDCRLLLDVAGGRKSAHSKCFIAEQNQRQFGNIQAERSKSMPLFPSYVHTVYTVKSGWKYEDFRIRMNGTSIRNLLPTNHGSKTTWRWDAVRKLLSCEGYCILGAFCG